MAIFGHQTGEIEQLEVSEFYEDVIRGLNSNPKFLSSKYFYDEEGDKLFRQIMQSPEYYLTRCEMEIFSGQTKALATVFLQRLKEFDVVELGAGDAIKSTHLLRHLKSKIDFTYYPVDISPHVIELLETEMPQRIPGLSIQGLNGEYFHMIRKSYDVSERRKVVLFLGSNIGNFPLPDVRLFLGALHQHLLPGDLLLIGFDLKKNPKQVLAAYNDVAGLTKAFNLNLLKRMNRELGADFVIGKFDHYPTYDPVTGSCRSFLISLCDQLVSVNGEKIAFVRDEAIYTELSQKYAPGETEALASVTGFKPVATFYDANRWFLDAIWERI